MIDLRRREMADHNDSVANPNICVAEGCVSRVRQGKTKYGKPTNNSRYCNKHRIRLHRHGTLADRWGVI